MDFVRLVEGADPVSWAALIVVLAVAGTQGISNALKFGIKGVFQGNKIGALTVQRNTHKAAVIRYDELPVAQQSAVGDCVDDVTEMYMSAYMTVKKELRGSKEGLLRDRDVHEYRLILEGIIKDKLWILFRKYIRENHILEKSMEALEIYVRNKQEEVDRAITRILDLWYWPEAQPERIALYDYNRKHVVPRVNGRIHEVFHELYRIADNHEKRARELDDAVKKLVP